MSEPENSPKKARGPRWIRRVVLFAAVAAGLFVLRLGVGVGTAYAHYSTTEDFETAAAAQAVPTEVVESRLPGGERLATDAVWTSGQSLGEGNEELGVAFDFSLRRGAEVLLETTVDVTGAVAPEDWARLGYRFEPPRVRTHPSFRAVVQLTLVSTDDPFVALTPDSRGRVFVDVLLVAGAGDDEFRVVRSDAHPTVPMQEGLHLSPWRILLGLVYPAGEVPEEGLVYHLQGNAWPNGSRTGTSSSTASLGDCEFWTNCHQYSFEAGVELQVHEGGRDSFSTSTKWAETYNWNGELW